MALLVPSAALRRRLPSALNAWLRRSCVWCLAAVWQLFSGRTQPKVWQRFMRSVRCPDRGVIRRKHRAVSACSVFWFLAPWFALVQSIGSRHLVLGAAINCRAAPASNQSQQYVAYGHRPPLTGRRCASALNHYETRSCTVRERALPGRATTL